VLALCAALKDDFSSVRWWAAAALGSLGPGVRTLTRTVGERRREVVIPALRERLRDREASVRIAAAAALLKVGYHNDELVQQLGQELLDPWGRLVRQPSDSRWHAAIVLRDLGPKAAPAVPLLMLALHDGDPAAIVPLAAIGPAAKRAIPALERMLDRSTDDGQRERIAFALIKAGGDGPGIVRARLDGRNAALTLALLKGLQFTHPERREFCPDLLRLMQDSSVAVRRSAIDALEATGARGEEVRSALLRALKDEDLLVRVGAVKALGAMGSEAKCAIPLLLDLLIQRTAEHRRAVVEVLGRIGPEDRQAFAALVET
jgi:HEAT repeat protein